MAKALLSLFFEDCFPSLFSSLPMAIMVLGIFFLDLQASAFFIFLHSGFADSSFTSRLMNFRFGFLISFLALFAATASS